MPVAGEEQQGRRFFSRKTDESDIMQWQLKPKCASSDTALELSYSIAADRMGGEQCDRRATPRSGAEAAKFTFMPTPRRQQSRNKSQMPVAGCNIARYKHNSNSPFLFYQPALDPNPSACMLASIRRRSHHHHEEQCPCLPPNSNQDHPSSRPGREPYP